MKGIFTIALRSLKEQLKSPVFWFILVAFPIAELFLFKGVFVNNGEAPQTVIKITQLYVVENTMTFNRLAINILGQFFLIGSVVASSYLLKEKENRTLMRTMTYPLTKSQIFIGHLLSLVLQLMLVIMLIMGLVSLIFKISWATNTIGLIIVAFLCVLLSATFGLFISLLFKNGNIASGLMSVTVIMMSFLNGDMTSGKLIFNNSDYFTLNKWITSAFVKLNKGIGFKGLIFDLLVISSLCLAFTLVSIALFRRENSYE